MVTTEIHEASRGLSATAELLVSYYGTFGYCRRKSVCLSVVCDVARWAETWNFSAIFLNSQIAQGLRHFVLNFGANIRKDSSGSCKLNTRG